MTTTTLLRVLVSLAAIAGSALPMSAPAASPAAIAPPVRQVAADCAGSSYATDRLVCSDAELSALDQTLVRMLADLPSQYRSVENPWLEDQQDWFKRRSLCAFDENHVECVRRAYHSRIAELGALASYTRDGKSLLCPLLPGASRYTISPQGLMTIRDKQGHVLLLAWGRESNGWRPFVSYRWERTKGRLTRQGDNTAMTCRSD